MPFNDYPLQSITVPGDASNTDPRIFIGDDDPILEFLDQTNGIVFYFGDGRAFIISVEADGNPNPEDIGRLHIWAFSENALIQMFDMDYDVPTSTVSVNTFQDSTTDLTENSVLGLNADIVGLGPDHQPLASEKQQDVFLFGTPMGRGVVNVVESVASSAAIGTSETVVMTLPSFTYRAGRAYEVDMSGGLVGSATTVLANFSVRKTNAVGQLLGDFYRYPVLSVTNVSFANGSGAMFTVAPGADVTATLVLTLKTDAGTATHFAAAGRPRRVKVRDVGDETLYPNAPVLV
jgi:hypothetical protein